jgi:hypothetical protein
MASKAKISSRPASIKAISVHFDSKGSEAYSRLAPRLLIRGEGPRFEMLADERQKASAMEDPDRVSRKAPPMMKQR